MEAIICWLQYVWSGIVGVLKYILRIDRPEDFKIKYRRSICAKCPWQVRTYFRIRKCGDCGCFIVPKTAIGSMPCPQGKWFNV